MLSHELIWKGTRQGGLVPRQKLRGSTLKDPLQVLQLCWHTLAPCVQSIDRDHRLQLKETHQHCERDCRRTMWQQEPKKKSKISNQSHWPNPHKKRFTSCRSSCIRKCVERNVNQRVGAKMIVGIWKQRQEIHTLCSNTACFKRFQCLQERENEQFYSYFVCFQEPLVSLYPMQKACTW